MLDNKTGSYVTFSYMFRHCCNVCVGNQDLSTQSVSYTLLAIDMLDDSGGLIHQNRVSRRTAPILFLDGIETVSISQLMQSSEALDTE